MVYCIEVFIVTDPPGTDPKGSLPALPAAYLEAKAQTIESFIAAETQNRINAGKTLKTFLSGAPAGDREPRSRLVQGAFSTMNTLAMTTQQSREACANNPGGSSVYINMKDCEIRDQVERMLVAISVPRADVIEIRRRITRRSATSLVHVIEPTKLSLQKQPRQRRT